MTFYNAHTHLVRLTEFKSCHTFAEVAFHPLRFRVSMQGVGHDKAGDPPQTKLLQCGSPPPPSGASAGLGQDTQLSQGLKGCRLVRGSGRLGADIVGFIPLDSSSPARIVLVNGSSDRRQSETSPLPSRLLPATCMKAHGPKASCAIRLL